MLNTEFVEGVKALIGTPYAKCDCKDVIAKPLGIRFSGTNWLWRSINNSSKYKYLVERLQTSMFSEDMKPGDILFKIRGGIPDSYNDSPDAYHVGVYMGAGKVVHSSPSTGVRESDYICSAWQGWGRMKQVEYAEESTEEESTEMELSDHEMIKAIYNKICEGGID